MKEKADTPEKKERQQVGVIRASRAMNQSNSMVSMRGFVPRFYNFWTLLTSKLSFWTYYDAKSPQTHAFGVVESSIKTGVYGQILPPAAGKLWEKSHVASSLVEPLGWYFCWHGITSVYGTAYLFVRFAPISQSQSRRCLGFSGRPVF